jgi:hypothetical protein
MERLPAVKIGPLGRLWARWPEVYTETGMRGVDENGCADVLRRHFPELTPALAGVRNPFAPWRPALV